MFKQRKEIRTDIENWITDYDGEQLHEMERQEGCAKYHLAWLMFGQCGQYNNTYDAHQFIEPNTFEVISYVKEHQEQEFGKVYCDFSDACNVANDASFYIAIELMRDEFSQTIDEMIHHYLEEEEEEESEEESEEVTA